VDTNNRLKNFMSLPPGTVRSGIKVFEGGKSRYAVIAVHTGKIWIPVLYDQKQYFVVVPLPPNYLDSTQTPISEPPSFVRQEDHPADHARRGFLRPNRNW
jgi:hypothetical protein